jgi:GMP synthase-like glutamine amidotransferase
MLVVEHVEGEGPGLLGEALGRFEVCRRWRNDPVPEEATHDGILVLGGSGSAWDPELEPEARLLAAYVRAGKPTLGICLGSQLLARGLGARNFRGPTLEKGLFPITLHDAGQRDPLLYDFDGATVMQWHEDSFTLPPGAFLLASSAQYPHQAFRVGERAWGVQLHVECDRRMRLDWSKDPSWAGGDEIDQQGRAFAARFAELVISSARG